MVLGIMQFGTTIPEATGCALLDRFVEAGGTWLDTANCYSFWSSPTGHGGQSETALGHWLAGHPDRRQAVRIATKVGCELVAPEVNPAGNEGLGGAVIRQAFADSLTRMCTDYVDLYWAHRDDRAVPQLETIEAFSSLVTSGQVGRWGYSNAPLWRYERARGLAEAGGLVAPTAMQLKHTYLQPRPLVRDHIHDHRFGWVTDEVMDYLQANPAHEAWAYTPQLAGAYNNPNKAIPEAFEHPGTTRRLAVLAKVAGALGWRPGQVVLAWMVGSDPAVVPIVGVSSLPQLEEALVATSQPLPAEFQAALDAPW
jgi:aryl-alcohol dehydrogenase-like predicted oxidoreductase